MTALLNALRIALVASLLFLTACDDADSMSDDMNAEVQSMSAPMGVAAYMGGNAGFGGSAKSMPRAELMAAAAPMMDADSAALQEGGMPPSSMVLDRSKLKDRRIAETHNLMIETVFDTLQPRYQRDYAKCIELGCEIVSSNIQLEQGGNIYARINPEKLGEFLDFLAKGEGRILNHNVSADDQTNAYSDLTAQMENLLAMRERMRKLLDSDKADKINDILRVEQELNRIQTEIDMRTARLRNLERVTDLATVVLNYSVQYRPAETKPYELKNTFKNAVQQFYRGLDRMIQFVGRTLPWIPVFAIGFWVGVWIVRLAFRKASFRWPWRKKDQA